MKKQGGFAFIIVLLLVAVALLVVVLIVGSTTPKEPTEDTKRTTGHLRGVALTPRAFTADGLNDFYSQAQSLGNSVSWHGDWAELGNRNKAPHGVIKTVRQHNLEPIILAVTHHEQQGEAIPVRPLTAQTTADYKRWAVEFAELYKPRYFGMGNEVNTIASSAPADFEVLVSLFNETAADIKRVSPDTQVFVTFQLERLKGLNGGLFGGRNDPTQAQWDLIDRFDADVIAFTTYPGLIYHAPSEIPAGYYDEITNHTVKPIAFSEVGWPAENVAAGWTSSPDLQQQFAELFLETVGTLNPEFMVWLLLYDQETAPAFKSMGLIDAEGNRRPAFGTWQFQ